MTHHDKIYIDGAWVASTGTGTIDVYDSTNGEVIAAVPDGHSRGRRQGGQGGGRRLRRRGHRRRRKSGPSTARASPKACSARIDEIATVVTREAGMPKWLSQLVQAGLPINSFNTAAQIAESFPYEEQVGNSLVVREPVGVVGAITPWNYPLHQIAAKVAYAMAAGCTVVLKPSEVAPLDAYILAEVIDEVGLPAGVFNLVSGTGAGRRQRHQQPPADRHGVVHRVRPEPGRRSPPTPPPRSSASPSSSAASRPTSSSTTSTTRGFEKAVRDGIGKAYLNSGQTCTALTRMLVPRERLADAERIAADEVETQVPADRPLRRGRHPRPAVEPGPGRAGDRLHPEGHRRGRQARHRRPRAARGRGLEGGYYVKPTVFSEVTNDMTIAREEIFGPVLSILPYDAEDDAVRIANDTRLRPVGRRVGAATPSGPRPSPGASAPARSRSTAAPSTRTRRSAATRSPATAASTAATASRSSSRSSRCSSDHQSGPEIR